MDSDEKLKAFAEKVMGATTVRDYWQVFGKQMGIENIEGETSESRLFYAGAMSVSMIIMRCFLEGYSQKRTLNIIDDINRELREYISNSMKGGNECG